MYHTSSSVFNNFRSFPLTLSFDKGHINWHAEKGFAKEYNLANLNDCSDDNVQENAHVIDLSRLSVSPCDLGLKVTSTRMQ